MHGTTVGKVWRHLSHQTSHLACRGNPALTASGKPSFHCQIKRGLDVLLNRVVTQIFQKKISRRIHQMPAYPTKRRRIEDSSSVIHGQTASSTDQSQNSSAVPVASAEYRSNGSTPSFSNRSRTSWPAATKVSDGSYHSNFFKLQLDELLKKIRPKYETRYVAAEGSLHRLREIINNIPDRKGLVVRYHFCILGHIPLTFLWS